MYENEAHSQNKMLSSVENDQVLVLERVFDAPRSLVFEMFKEPEHLKRWWGPRGWELPVCNVDFRPGGVWHYCMKCVDEAQVDLFGMESWGKGIYRQIEAPEKIIYTDFFSDAEGNENDAMPSTEVTLEFIDLGGKTKLVSRAEYATAEALQMVMDMGLLQGITETWNRLEERIDEIK